MCVCVCLCVCVCVCVYSCVFPYMGNNVSLLKNE